MDHQAPSPAPPARSAAIKVAEAEPTRWTARAPADRSPAERALRQICRAAGKLIIEAGLIRQGDRVLCAVSGGKDSLSMVEALLRLKSRAPVRFELGAVTVQPGFDGFDDARVTGYCASLGLETWVVRGELWAAMRSVDQRGTPCALCARFRRGVLYRVAAELGFNVLALGHHADDAIETLLMNMVFAGKLRAMAPLTLPKEAPVRVIRPLLRVFEAQTRAYAAARGLPVVECGCPLGCSLMGTERRQMKALVEELASRYPRARQSMLGALGNLTPEAFLDDRFKPELARRRLGTLP